MLNTHHIEAGVLHRALSPADGVPSCGWLFSSPSSPCLLQPLDSPLAVLSLQVYTPLSSSCTEVSSSLHLRPSKCILHLRSAGCSRRPRHSQSTSTSVGPATRHSNSAISPAPTSTSCRGASTARDRLSGCAGDGVWGGRQPQGGMGSTQGAETHGARETHIHTRTHRETDTEREMHLVPLDAGKAHPPGQDGKELLNLAMLAQGRGTHAR